MIVIWLIAWLIGGHPHLHPWTGWFTFFVIALVLTAAHVVSAGRK